MTDHRALHARANRSQQDRPDLRCVAGQPVDRATRSRPGCYLVATPIGNLRDITLRALEMLAAADLIACEDTRVTRKLLDHYGITTPLTPYHEHNAAAARPKLLARLAAGDAVALVSDAGTPLDFRSRASSWCARRSEAGHAVTAAAGRLRGAGGADGRGPADRPLLLRGLPARQGRRSARTRIAELARIPATLVLFESGPRLAAALADLADGPRRARGRRLPRAHQAARGGAARRSGGARARLCATAPRRAARSSS